MSDTSVGRAGRVRAASPLLVAVVALVVLLVSPPLLGPYYVGVAASVGITALLALGIVLITGYAGQFSLAQAAFFGVGAYTSGLATVRWSLPPTLGLLVGLVIAVAVAYALGRPVFRLRGHFLAMGTLALAEIFYLVVRTTGALGAASGFGGIPTFSLFGVETGSLDHQYFLVWITVGLGVWGLTWLRRGREGRALLAVRGHEVAAAACGVDVGSTKTRAFAGSAAFGSLAGSLYAHQLLYVNPSPFSPLTSVDILAVVVLGGLLTPWGAVVGAVLYQLLQQGVSIFLPRVLGEAAVGAGETLVVGVLVVSVLILRPDGVAGAAASLLRLARRRTTTVDGADEAPPSRDSQASPARAAQGAATTTATSADSPTLLRTQGLTKRYGGVTAVDEVELTLRRGEVLGVIGPNGAGKSTLINLLSGVTAPTAGEMHLDGRDLRGEPPHARARLGLARTFQTPALFPSLSVLQNVQVGAHVTGTVGMTAASLPSRGALREESRLRTAATTALDRVGLRAVADRRATDLSLGEQKLVEVARAMVATPQVLLLDEPAAGLNRADKQRLARTIEQLRDDGVSLILIEHDMEFVMGLVDRVHVLEFGRTLRVGLPGEVQADPDVIRAYLGADDEDDIDLDVQEGPGRATSEGMAASATTRGEQR